MTLHDFAQLDTVQQVKTFWKEGVVVGQRFEEESLVECRQVDDFYIEYKILERNNVDLRCFKSPDWLAPYLEQMKVDLDFAQ